MGAGRRTSVVVGALGAAMVLLLAIPLGIFFVLDRAERALAGPCGRDSSTSPRRGLGSGEVADYEQANVRMLDDLVRVLGPHSAPEHDRAFKCPNNADRDAVVGVTTRATFAMLPGVERCVVVRKIEQHLSADGWATWSLQTSEVNGPGHAGQTSAWRNGALLTAAVQPANRLIYVGVDKATEVPVQVPPPGVEAPCDN